MSDGTVSPDPLPATPSFTPAELAALSEVMSARYDNVVETRQQTGDTEYTEDDEDQCSALVFAIDDFSDPLQVASLAHLDDAIWNALETPEAFEDLDFDALRSAAAKLGQE